VRADGGFGVSAAQCFDVSAGSFRRAWYDSISKPGGIRTFCNIMENVVQFFVLADFWQHFMY